MRFRLPVALVSLVAGVFGAGVAAADSGSEQTFISYTSSARAQHGLRSYAVHSDLTATARRWAGWMAAHHTLEHNPSVSSDVCCWRDLGENVGRGGSAGAIENAFMASPEHRANILSGAFTQIGVGTARGSDGALYVDELFRRPTAAYSTRSVSAPAAVPAPAVRPAVAGRSVRASRSYARAPRATGPDPITLFRHRLGVIGHRIAPAAAKADPVGQAFLYATAMRAVG